MPKINAIIELISKKMMVIVIKYLKWIYEDISNQDGYKYKIGEVNTTDNWNPEGGLDSSGGFNFTNEECTLRWSTRSDTLYDVIIPEDGEVEIMNESNLDTTVTVLATLDHILSIKDQNNVTTAEVGLSSN